MQQDGKSRNCAVRRRKEPKALNYIFHKHQVSIGSASQVAAQIDKILAAEIT